MNALTLVDIMISGAKLNDWILARINVGVKSKDVWQRADIQLDVLHKKSSIHSLPTHC